MGSPEAGVAAPATAALQRPLVRRGVVIVHGVGEQGKGEYIDSFVEPLASFVADACGSENVAITVRNEEGSSSWATLHIKGDSHDEDWHIREAWWARNFRPSASKTVLFWGILAGLTILWATWKSIFVRAVARLRHDYQQMTLSLDDLFGRPLDPATLRLKRDTEQGLWVVPQTHRAKAVLDGCVWLFNCVLYLVGALVLLALLVPIYIFLLLPLSLFLPGPVVSAQRKFVGLLVSSIGDQQAMTTRRFALAGASNEVAQALWYMLSPDGLKRSKRADETFAGYETVTVVAHSGGVVVSFDALAGEVKKWMEEESPAGMKRPKRVTWITAGSGLNLAFRMRRTRDSRETAFWNRSITGFVNWVNIYARYDPVPQGPPPHELVATVLGPDPWLADNPDATQSRPPFVCLRVVNADFPGTDHSGYWKNRTEVMSRVVALITDSGRAAAPISPQADAFPVTLGAGLDAAIRRESNPTATRTSRANALRRQVPMYITIAVLVAVAILGVVLGRTFLKIDVVDEVFPHKLLGRGIDGQREWLAGVSIGFLLGLIVGQLLGFLRQLVGWARSGGSWAVVPAGGLMVALGLGMVGLILVFVSRMIVSK